MSTLTTLKYVEAWRYWRILESNDQGNDKKLVDIGSTFVRHVWYAGFATSALCNHQDICVESRRDQECMVQVPSFLGECGLYGYSTQEKALQDKTPHWGEVLGTVALWGKLIEHKGGWRAQYGYPLTLQYALCWICGRPTPLDQTLLLGIKNAFSILICKAVLNLSTVVLCSAVIVTTIVWYVSRWKIEGVVIDIKTSSLTGLTMGLITLLTYLASYLLTWLYGRRRAYRYTKATPYKVVCSKHHIGGLSGWYLGLGNRYGLHSNGKILEISMER